MIVKNQYGEIDFGEHLSQQRVIDENVSKVAVTLSGGVDSSLVMYLLCEYIMKNNIDYQILPFTGVDKLRPTNEWYAREIALYFKEKYPNIKFLDHYTFKYDHEPGNTHHKRKNHIVHERRLYTEEDIKIFFCGKSANPPKDEAIKHGLWSKREEERDTDDGDWQSKVFFRAYTGPNNDINNRFIYRPLAFQHKKFIAQCYEDFGLMEELFPMTASCIAYEENSNYFSEPCKKCWWCKEKHWAFGMYDGGIE